MQNKRDLLVNSGIVMAFSGVSCMAMVKGLIGQNQQVLSIISVIAAVAFMCRGVNVRRLKRPTREATLIFIYSAITLFLAFASDINFMQSGYGFIYQAAYFIEIILIWNCNSDVDMSKFVSIGFWVCGFACCIACYLLMKDRSGSLFYNNYLSSKGDYLFDREATGTISFMAYAMTLAYKAHSSTQKILKTIFIVISLLVVAISSRRSVYVAVAISLLLYLRNTRHTERKNIGHIKMSALSTKRVGMAIALFFLFLMLCRINTQVGDTVAQVWMRLWNGIRTLLGVETSDQSVAMRTSAVSVALKKWWSGSSIIHFVFGNGYMDSWIDIPLLQAVIDLGILGGGIYFLCAFIIPISHLMRGTDSRAIQAAQYLVALSVAEGVANSFPYGHFFTIILLLRLEQAGKKKLESNS